jgi:hypothetical protein
MSPNQNALSPGSVQPDGDEPSAQPFSQHKLSEHANSPFSKSAARRHPGSLMTTKGTNNRDLKEAGVPDSSADRNVVLSRGTDLQAWNNKHRGSTQTEQEAMMMSSAATTAMPKGDSILKLYVKQLMQSGRTDPEIVTDLEQYYNQLCSNCDMEILRLKEEFEIVQAEDRTGIAEELIHTHDEIERLSNFFIDCIYASRKSMRLKLIRQEVEQSRKPV